MVLVDTSVWVNHLRNTDQLLVQLLTEGQVCMHSTIMGELACGHLQNREELLKLWQHLPGVLESSHEEALFSLHAHQLMGPGIGLVDVHLLSSTLLTPDALLCTYDKRLAQIAEELQIGFPLD